MRPGVTISWRGVGARGRGGGEVPCSGWGIPGRLGSGEHRGCSIGPGTLSTCHSGAWLRNPTTPKCSCEWAGRGVSGSPSLPVLRNQRGKEASGPKLWTPGNHCLPPAPTPSPKSAKSRRGRERLDFASLSSIFCLMSPGPIVGEESTSPRP